MSFICPNCGTEVKMHSPACPECGSDERTGWSENTLYDNLDLPDDAFDDHHLASPSKQRRRAAFLALIGVVLLLIFVLRFIFGV